MLLKILRIFKKHWPLILLIIITILLRLYKLESLFYFSYDEEIPSFVARRLILLGHIPLIGGVTPFGFHLGPYFYWFLTALMFVGKLDPITWGVASAVISGVTTFLIFYIGKTFFNKKIGYTAAILWTFSYLANIYDRHLWALYWGPIISLVTIFSLWQIIKNNKNHYWIVLGTTLALGIHTDLSNGVFILYTILLIIFYKIKLKKESLIGFLIFILSFLPLVIFDLRHNFANSAPAIKYFQDYTTSKASSNLSSLENILIFPNTFSRLIYSFGDQEVSKIYSYCNNTIVEKSKNVPASTTIFASVLIIFFLLIAKKKNPKKLLALLFLTYFFSIVFYGIILKHDIFEHYLSGIFPMLFLIAAFLISKLPKPIWLIFLSMFMSFNLFNLYYSRNENGLLHKKNAIRYVSSQLVNEPFSIDSLSTCWKYGGYRYLFSASGKEPVKSFVDPNLNYLYEDVPVSIKHPDAVVVFVTHDFYVETSQFYKQYALYKSREISSKIFGNIEVIIMDNSSGWFN